MTVTGKMWWVWRLRVFLEKLFYGAPRKCVVGFALQDGLLLIAQMDPDDGLIYSQCACTLSNAREFRESLNEIITKMELINNV